MPTLVLHRITIDAYFTGVCATFYRQNTAVQRQNPLFPEENHDVVQSGTTKTPILPKGTWIGQRELACRASVIPCYRPWYQQNQPAIVILFRSEPYSHVILIR